MPKVLIKNTTRKEIEDKADEDKREYKYWTAVT